MSDEKFNLQAALEALHEIEALTLWHDLSEPTRALLRDLRERLAGAQEAWQINKSGAVVFAFLYESHRQNARPVLIIPIDGAEEPKQVGTYNPEIGL